MASLLGGVVGKLDGFGSSMGFKAKGLLDGVFPPEKRAELLARLKAFILKNPKVSAFLLTNVALSAGPLILFAFFSLTVFVFSLIVALVIGLLAAVALTLFAVGVALFVLFPTVFFTTLTATFLFLWGLGGYYLFKHFNKQSAPGAKGDTIGDKLNSLTGNRLGFVMDNAREGWAERQLGPAHKDWDKGASPHHGAEPVPRSNGTSKGSSDTATTSGSDAPKRSDSPLSGMRSSANGVKKNLNAGVAQNAAGHVTKTVDLGETTEKVKVGPRKLNNATGTIKGTAVGSLGGATGLM